MTDGDADRDADPDSRSRDDPATVTDDTARGGEYAEPTGGTERSAHPDRSGRSDGSDVSVSTHDAPGVPDGETTQPPVDELTGPMRRLHPRVRFVWILGAAISALVAGAMTGVVGLLVVERPVVGVVVFLLVFLVGSVLAVFRYRSWRYEVRADSLYLERGVLTHTRTVVPYVRIQHVDASRGPVERLFGLATAVVYTAGSRGADVSIPGLTPQRADDLQERLKGLAIAAEGEDAV